MQPPDTFPGLQYTNNDRDKYRLIYVKRNLKTQAYVLVLGVLYVIYLFVLFGKFTVS